MRKEWVWGPYHSSTNRRQRQRLVVAGTSTAHFNITVGHMRIERIAPFAYFGLGGDSGSLVVAKQSLEAVGLYFAGPPSGIYAVANHIQNVLNELEIQLL